MCLAVPVQESSVDIGSFTEAVKHYINRGFEGADDAEQPPLTDAVAEAIGNLTGPEESLEFLARRLLHVTESGKLYGERGVVGDYSNRGSYQHVLLGTPIYVAQAEE